MITELFAIDERINTPGSTHSHNWSFRLPWTLEEIRADQRLNEICRKLAIAISLTRGKPLY